MRNEIVILNSDAINRYNMRFNASVLESSLKQKWRTGTPCNLGHDQTRTIGWMQPLSLYFEPRRTLLMGVLIEPDTDEESEIIAKARFQYLYDQQLERCQKFESQLKERIGTKISGNAKLVDAGVPSYFERNLAVRCFSMLFEPADKDGLIPLNKLKHLGDGIFEFEGLALFGHAFFRRSASLLNHVNHHFFNTIEKDSVAKDNLLIALDRDLVGWADAYQKYIELEYWWGPKFHDNLAAIPTGVSRHEATDFQRYYSGILRSEFWWQSRKGEHILEIEELKNIPESDGKYHCRYLHCIVDESTKRIIHLDGAVRLYSEDKMIERIEQSIETAGRNTVYTKLWRLDQNLEIKQWKRVVSDYFTGNHLVGEYLGFEPETQIVRPQTATEVQGSLGTKARWVPYSIEKSSGVRLSISYHDIQVNNYERFVRPIDTITIGDDKFIVVSLFTVELKKLLMRSGQDLFIPDQIKFVACEDLYLNLPVIGHNQMAAALGTLNAIEVFLQWAVKCQHDRAIAFTLAYPLCDREIQLSVYGHAEGLLKSWSMLFNSLPTDDDSVSKYAENVAAALSIVQSSETPVVTEIVRTTGVLWLNRRMVEPDMNIKPKFDHEEGRLGFTMDLPPKYHDFGKSLNSGELSIRVCCMAEFVRCSLCGQSHLTCPCSVVLDGATKYIEKIIPAGFVITDRPA